MPPLIVQKYIILPLPGPDDRRAHDQRVREVLGMDRLVIPLSLLNRLASALKAGDDGMLPQGEGRPFICTVGLMGSGAKLIDINRPASYSLALDLGTTNMVFLLVDNTAGKIVLTMSFENPQIAFGSDILTRMHHAMSPQAQDIYDALKQGINRAIRAVCERAHITTDEIHALVAAGNTVMSHFFLGLDISTIPVDPFVPVVRTPGFFGSRELGLELNAEAVVYVFPNAGSYVGGDIVAGIIAAGIDRAEGAFGADRRGHECGGRDRDKGLDDRGRGRCRSRVGRRYLPHRQEGKQRDNS